MISYLQTAVTDWRLLLPLVVLLLSGFCYPDEILLNDSVKNFFANQGLELMAIILTVSLAAFVNFAVQLNSISRTILKLVKDKDMKKDLGLRLQANLSATVELGVHVAKLLAFIYLIAAVLVFWGDQTIKISASLNANCTPLEIRTVYVANYMLLALLYLYFYILVDIFISQIKRAQDSLKLTGI